MSGFDWLWAALGLISVVCAALGYICGVAAGRADETAERHAPGWPGEPS